MTFGSRTLIIALAGLAVVLAGCGQQPPQAGPPPPGERIPEQEIVDYRLIESQGGVRRWTLDSKRMRKFTGQEDLELDDVKMDFYKDGVYSSTLTSEHGTANPTKKNMLAWGHVVVTTVDGKKLETEELRYESTKDRISNQVFNRFTRGEDVVTGYGMEANPTLDTFELKERIGATLTDEPPAGGKTP
jgi:LPS export ABC transporter protein LptC